jgi:hypothetical protein
LRSVSNLHSSLNIVLDKRRMYKDMRKMHLNAAREDFGSYLKYVQMFAFFHRLLYF